MATHLREGQQKNMMPFRNEGCTLGAFCERHAPAPRACDFFFDGLAMKKRENIENIREREGVERACDSAAP
jgi:hypothetical protein